VSLPSAYREFLLRSDGGTPEPNQFSIPGLAEASGVNEFLSGRQIMSERHTRRHRLPAAIIPIGYAEGGNLVCLKVPEGDILFWDHELEGKPGGLVRLADGFDAFWRDLSRLSIHDVELSPDQVKSVWVDPDLLRTSRKKNPDKG